MYKPRYTDAIGIVVENKYERRSIGRTLLKDFVFGVTTGVTAGLVIRFFWPTLE